MESYTLANYIYVILRKILWPVILQKSYDQCGILRNILCYITVILRLLFRNISKYIAKYCEIDQIKKCKFPLLQGRVLMQINKLMRIEGNILIFSHCFTILNFFLKK